jgi:hypothetical protein
MKLISAVLVVLALVLSQSKSLRGLFGRIAPRRGPAADMPEPMLDIPASGREEP